MKKKSIIAIMMLLTISTAVFVSCDNNKDYKEKSKAEVSIDNDKKDSKKVDINKQEEHKNNNEVNQQKDNSKDSNKSKIKNKVNNENKDKKQTENLSFTPQKAIEIAKQKYGTQKGNILYSYKEEPYISDNKKGYYIKLSSKTMIEQGGTGTLTWLLVTNDGDIIEDPRMN